MMLCIQNNDNNNDNVTSFIHTFIHLKRFQSVPAESVTMPESFCWYYHDVLSFHEWFLLCDFM